MLLFNPNDVKIHYVDISGKVILNKFNIYGKIEMEGRSNVVDEEKCFKFREM